MTNFKRFLAKLVFGLMLLPRLIGGGTWVGTCFGYLICLAFLYAVIRGY